jgi:hypothetical protein
MYVERADDLCNGNQAKEPANGSTIVRKNRPTTYRDLPPEIIQQVTDYLPFDLIGDLSTVDRRTYHVLRERRLRYLCYARALHLKDNNFDLASVLQLLAEIERIRAHSALRAEPLRRLAWLILDLPGAQKSTAFALIFEACRPHALDYNINRQPSPVPSIHTNAVIDCTCSYYDGPTAIMS